MSSKSQNIDFLVESTAHKTPRVPQHIKTQFLLEMIILALETYLIRVRGWRPLLSVNSQLFAHRGLWKTYSWADYHDQNSIAAIELAAENGFNLETDIRDYNGQIVISHDPLPSGADSPALSSIKDYPHKIALNIKADGLLTLLGASSLPKNYFFFDASFPEFIKYKNANFEIATRISDFEQGLPNEKIYWVDFFKNPFWFNYEPDTETDQSEFVLVSPELHGQDHLEFWEKFKPLILNNKNISICTDYPLELVNFLND